MRVILQIYVRTQSVKSSAVFLTDTPKLVAHSETKHTQNVDCLSTSLCIQVLLTDKMRCDARQIQGIVTVTIAHQQ